MRVIAIRLFCIFSILFTGIAFVNEMLILGATHSSVPRSIIPTVGRTVLARVRDTNGRIKELPMIVTDVHSDHCVSGIALSAYSVESLHAGGTLPLTSLTYSESDANHHTWHWMPVQSTGGGFAARLDNLEDRIRHLDDMEGGIRRLGESIGSIAVAKAPEHVAESRKAEKPKIKFYPSGIDQALNDGAASKAGSEPMKNPHA